MTSYIQITLVVSLVMTPSYDKQCSVSCTFYYMLLSRLWLNVGICQQVYVIHWNPQAISFHHLRERHRIHLGGNHTHRVQRRSIYKHVLALQLHGYCHIICSNCISLCMHFFRNLLHPLPIHETQYITQDTTSAEKSTHLRILQHVRRVSIHEAD